ncbi:MAG: hypothetical protein KA714_04350 [Limnoraphis sp. WC205]|nr:hypothetical protein [Limnoraphis sp. WC205]
MSKQLYFYKLQPFEEIAEYIPPENIANSLKALIEKIDLESTDNDKLKEKLFFELEDIDYNLRELNSELSSLVQKVEFLANTGYFIMTQDILNAIGKKQGLLGEDSRQKKENKKGESNKNNEPENNNRIKADYEKLKKLLDQNLLIGRDG